MQIKKSLTTRFVSSIYIALLLIAGVVSSLSAQGEQKQTTQSDEVQKLIREVEQNEKLYDELKLNLTSKKIEKGFLSPFNWTNPIENETQISLDVQGLKFRQDNQSKGRYIVKNMISFGGLKERKNPANASYTVIGTEEWITVCDGQTCRDFWTEDLIAEKKGKQKQISKRGLISDKPQRLSNLARPHMFLLANGVLQIPLSTYLKGGSFPGSSFLGKGRVCNVRILGTEEFQGLRCMKILIEILDPKGVPRTRRELWLARGRNLIPVRTLSYTYKDSKDIAIAEGIVDELQEVRPGVWFPLKAHYKRFYSMTVKRESRQELAWQIKYKVNGVQLDPQFPPEIFTTLKFPPGTQVTLNKDGKLTRLKEGNKSP